MVTSVIYVLVYQRQQNEVLSLNIHVTYCKRKLKCLLWLTIPAIYVVYLHQFSYLVLYLDFFSIVIV